MTVLQYAAILLCAMLSQSAIRMKDVTFSASFLPLRWCTPVTSNCTTLSEILLIITWMWRPSTILIVPLLKLNVEVTPLVSAFHIWTWPTLNTPTACISLNTTPVHLVLLFATWFGLKLRVVQLLRMSGRLPISMKHKKALAVMTVTSMLH